jgi:hypothetical protein
MDKNDEFWSNNGLLDTTGKDLRFMEEKKQRKKRLGDRSDGWRLRGIDPYDAVSPYIMVERCDAQNYFSDKFEITAAEKYAKEKRAQGYKNFSLMHVIMAAYLRTMAEKPYLNRFLSGQKVYARNNVQFNMAVKKEISADQTNTVIKVYLDPADTAIDVYEKFTKTYDDAFAVEENAFDGVARILSYIPGVIKKFVVWFLKLLDYFGGLPRFLTRLSPFHGSFFITSMGSLGIPPIYHHLYNFGNVPIFLSFGAKYRQNKINDDGAVERHSYVDFTVVMDERICDGFYFASALKLMKNMARNPWILDEVPEIIRDIK